MTKWIKCSEEYPPARVKVKVMINNVIYTALRCWDISSTHLGSWKFAGDVFDTEIRLEDMWMRICDFENEGKNIMYEHIFTLNNYYNLKLVKEEKKQGGFIVVGEAYKPIVKALVKGLPEDNILNLKVGSHVLIDLKYGQAFDDENFIIKKDYILGVIESKEE